MNKVNGLRPDTILTHGGRDPQAFGGVVNVPVVRASTILYPDLQAYESSRVEKFSSLRYGRYGTQTTFALEEAVAALDGGFRATSFPSGLSAIANVLRALLRPGDHLLMVDTVYGPARKFCDEALARDGISTTYYDPAMGAELVNLITDRTRVVYCESPGSLTFEVQDIPAITSVCRPRGIAVVADNTWATPLFFQAFARGVDVSIHAATKYIVGHSDAMLGIAVTTEEYFERVRGYAAEHGVIAGPDDCWLGLRGLRTLGARLRQHQQSSEIVLDWLLQHPAVSRAYYPALAGHASHALWRRDFTGASGLFGLELVPARHDAIHGLINALKLFGIGSSWGGYESLILPSKPIRTASQDRTTGPLLRINIGLEDPDDLIADLEAGLSVFENQRRDLQRRMNHAQ
ncbi:cystathionine beta-lyase [Mesorhizobium muleiense]|uniref:cystathionine beta-lyase n=1 Tax=Mesorhizobium muleiense TaxID=1004279 RepID=UPI003AFA4E25